jgi:hypothetical protein
MRAGGELSEGQGPPGQKYPMVSSEETHEFGRATHGPTMPTINFTKTSDGAVFGLF